jgi:hypothetical protein
MKERQKKAMNMNKTTEAFQRTDKSPSQFYEWLWEVFCLYTPFNSEAFKNQRMINAAFVTQAQGDIKQKLQKLEGFAGMYGSKLLEVATKVFVIQDREANRKIKRKVDLLAAALAKLLGGSQHAGHGRRRRQSPWMVVSAPGIASS